MYICNLEMHWAIFSIPLSLDISLCGFVLVNIKYNFQIGGCCLHNQNNITSLLDLNSQCEVWISLRPCSKVTEPVTNVQSGKPNDKVKSCVVLLRFLLVFSILYHVVVNTRRLSCFTSLSCFCIFHKYPLFLLAEDESLKVKI